MFTSYLGASILIESSLLAQFVTEWSKRIYIDNNPHTSFVSGQHWGKNQTLVKKLKIACTNLSSIVHLNTIKNMLIWLKILCKNTAKKFKTHKKKLERVMHKHQ